ncbi:MAG: AAA family ATPase, partial [Planctomycetota bacterium]
MEKIAGPKPPNTQASKADIESDLIARLPRGCEKLKQQIHRVIVGQDKVLDSMLCCMLAGGHCIVQGVPGLAKTLT